ncbi:MAG: hypothetical protein ACLP9L_08445 [Thermoguttaceae bacterium]
MVKRCRWACVMWIALAVSGAQAAGAKESQSEADKVSPPASALGSAAPVSAAEGLSTTQQQLAAEFKDFQGILMKMRDQVRQTDPNRAVLIEKALKESGERHVEADFQDIVNLLRRDKFGDAARKQGKVNEDLDAILKLLLSEDRSKRIQDEKALVRKYLNLLNGIIREQKDVQGRTAGGDDPKSLSGEQGSLAQRTGNLSKDIGENQEKARSNDKDDGKRDSKKDGKNRGKNDGKAEGKPQSGSDGKSPGKSDGKAPKSSAQDPSKSNGKGDGQAKDPSESSGKGDGQAKPGESGKSQGDSQGKGKSQQGQGQGQGQGEGQNEDQNDSPQQAQDSNSQPQEQNPVRKRLEAAKDHMEEAKKRLENARKDGALDEQEKALRELDSAKAELEEILRQLREEEMKRLLAMLEARFQKVLQIQREIYGGTLRLDKIPVVERSHAYEIDTGRLSNREAEIVMEVEKALSLLREEGSSVAMPEAVQQVHDDMQQLVHRLAEGKTEVVTQAIETDVIKGLEEILDALKKAQKNADNKKKPPGPSPNGQPQDPPLIEQLAELKMIRALQMRVNRRTERYRKLVKDEQADKEGVLDALRLLSEQQARVYKVTRDLELGKNE